MNITPLYTEAAAYAASLHLKLPADQVLSLQALLSTEKLRCTDALLSIVSRYNIPKRR